MILVPIDMPENCGECYFCASYEEMYPLKCYLTYEEVNPYGDDRLEICPLIDASYYKEEKDV